MKNFITSHSKKIISFAVVLAWLVIWEITAAAVNQPLFFPPLSSVIKTLVGLLGTGGFYVAVLNSFYKITLGFVLSVIIGLLLAVAAARFDIVRIFLRPLMSVIKSTPVASFIILALILVSSSYLSVLIAFLMSVPIIYTNTLSGITSIDKTMFEAADVFNMDNATRLRHIYFPEVFPYFNAGCTVALGLCWKAGVAAEVIGISAKTIGEKLYESKINLNIPELFSYTLVIILISILFEKLVSYLLKKLYKRILG